MENTVIAASPLDIPVRALTLERLHGVVALMRKHAIPPCVVKTEKEAHEMTKADRYLTGHKWKVGEEYYRAEMLHQTMPALANAGDKQ